MERSINQAVNGGAHTGPRPSPASGIAAMSQRNSADGGTVLESLERVASHLAAGTRPEPVAAVVPHGVPQPVQEPFRPVIRPAVPRLVILDDGDQAGGEIVRLREASTFVGRDEGHVRLPHDPLVSGRHAEIVRQGTGHGSRWVLRDLGSANGTFVRCGRAVLRPDRLLIIGGRRLRFRPAGVMPEEASLPAGTRLMDAAAVASTSWPALVETAQSAGGREFLLGGASLFLGRPGCGNAVEWDDPLLAPRHARVFRGATGGWTIEALPSLNGVWMQVAEVELADLCRFQCGEQRFLFLA